MSRKWMVVFIAVLLLVMAGVVAGCGPSQEEVYAQAVQPQLEKIGNAFGDVSTLFGELSKDETKWDDPAWKGKLKADGDIVKQGHEAIKALTPPDSLKDIHAQLLSATQDCADAMDKLNAGVESKNMDTMNQAITLGQSCGSKMNALGDQLKSK